MVNTFVAQNLIPHSNSAFPHSDITALIDMAGSAVTAPLFSLDAVWFGLDVFSLLLTGLYLVKLLLQRGSESNQRTENVSRLNPSLSQGTSFAWVEPALMQASKRSLGEQQVMRKVGGGYKF